MQCFNNERRIAVSRCVGIIAPVVMKSFFTHTAFIFIFSLLSPACETTADDSYTSPTVISGTVKDGNGLAVFNAKISLSTAGTFEGVFTDANGLFHLTGFPAGKHRVKIEKIGFEVYDGAVPNPINGVSTISAVLQKKTYIIPTAKPTSTGPVRIKNKTVETDFDGDGVYAEFIIKGAAFSPMPIGGKPITKEIYDRSNFWLKGLNANTVRTYSGVDKYFLRQAALNNIRVIVSFWVNLDLDLSLVDVRQTVIDNFAAMVLDLKDFPGVLMWNIGNEQNYSSTPNNGNSPYWYSLTQEMAIAAYKVEGEKYHPVCISNGHLYNIGESGMKANDSSITYIDLWASNAYEMNFTNFFSTYRTRTTKPIVITEFGIDALNNANKIEYESIQAYVDSVNWMQIRTAKDVCVGATVFEFTDEWWKATGDVNSHDYGGYQTSAHPDGYSNEEWWGIVAVTPDTDNDGMDEWRPRMAFEMFSRNWK